MSDLKRRAKGGVDSMMNKSNSLMIFCAVIALAGTACPGETPMIKLTQEKDTISVEIGGKPFTTYYFADGKGLSYTRPFFYPVLAPDSTEVTSDQANVKGGDHPHHRSLWVAHGDVNGADHWALNLKGAQIPKQRHIKFTKVEGDTIEEQLEWEGKTFEPILRETRTFRFMQFKDGSRGIDFTLVFTPISEPVTFGDTKEAGLCAVRMAKEISAHAVITNSTGDTGEKKCWGKPAAWCDESGEINGKPYGITIIDHPANPRYPSTWHVREYGLMSANIFGLHDFDKTKPKGAGNFTIEKDKPVTFRYRVVVHGGDAKSAGLDEKAKEFGL